MGVIEVEYINSCGKRIWLPTEQACEGNCTPAPTTPTISASALSICGSEQTTISSVGGNGTITWYRNNAPTGQTGSSINVSETGGTYKAKSVTTCGESSFSNEIVISYQANCGCTPAPTTPTISSGSTTVCGSNTVTLSASNSNGIVRWFRGGVFVGQGSTYEANVSGVYTATTLTGCGESAPSNTITIANTGACPSNFNMTIGTINTTC